MRGICVLQRESRRKKGSLLQYKCGVCNAQFTSSFRRDRHLRTHSSAAVSTDLVVCRLCGKKCVRDSYLITHLQSQHQLVYFCSVCGAFFPSSLRLVSHLNAHQNSSSSESPTSSADLFWQSISKSVLLPQSNSSTVSWLTSGTDILCDEQISRRQNDGLDDVLQDVDCQSFTHSDSEMLTGVTSNSPLEYSREVVECRDGTPAEHCDVNAFTEAFDVASVDRDVCLMMGYKPMSVDVFSRLRQTFGCIECEHCGQLFFVQSDLDKHMNVHTGMSLLSHSLLPCFFNALMLLVE